MEKDGVKAMYRRVRWWPVLSAALILTACAATTLAKQGSSAGPAQAGLYKAATRDYARADKVLNRAYEQLARALEPEPRAKLKVAELAWLRFRDAEGEFRASEFKGAKLQPAARLGYLEDLTRRRTQELNNAYKQFAGD